MADLIDRSALLDEIQHDIENSGCVNHEREIMDCVRYAPAIDAVPVVHARWEKKVYREETKYREEISSFHCSNCGGGNSDFLPKYCSNCGARMDADAPERDGKDGQDG
jgi:hypothetical protein